MQRPPQNKSRTMIVTGASQGIGAGLVAAFLERGYSVVGNSRKILESGFARTEKLALVDGNIAEASTAAKIVDTALSHTPCASRSAGGMFFRVTGCRIVATASLVFSTPVDLVLFLRGIEDGRFVVSVDSFAARVSPAASGDVTESLTGKSKLGQVCSGVEDVHLNLVKRPATPADTDSS